MNVNAFRNFYEARIPEGFPVYSNTMSFKFFGSSGASLQIDQQVNVVGFLHKRNIFVSMKTFTSMEEAFKWWLTNIYPSLPAEVKKGKLTNAWRDFTHKRGISHARMQEILSEYGDIEVQILIKYTPK